MKNNEMVSRGNVSINLPEKFADDHPVAATVVCLLPVLIPPICKGAKYLVDKFADCYRFKVMAENGMIVTEAAEIYETVPTNDSIAA